MRVRAAALALAVGVGMQACGGHKQAENPNSAYCQTARDDDQRFQAAFSRDMTAYRATRDQPSKDRLVADIRDGNAAAHELARQAPPKIKADAELTATASDSYLQGLERANFAFEKVDADAVRPSQTPEYKAAAKRLNDYRIHVCKITATPANRSQSPQRGSGVTDTAPHPNPTTTTP